VGDPVWVHEVGAGVFSAAGELQFLEGFIINNTERKRMEVALRDAEQLLLQRNLELQQSLAEKKIALDMAEAANRAKSSFLAVTSHELRTPLNAVIGFSDLMLSDVDGRLNNEKDVEYLRFINASGKMLLSRVDDIIDVTRIEAGNYRLAIGPVDMAEVWEHVAKELQMAASSKDVRLFGPKSTGGLKFQGDIRAMSRIVTKLVDNAIRFTGIGGEIHVDVVEAATESEVAFVVRDNGEGISSDMVANVVEPFVQGSDGHSRSTAGVGLGLTICKLLAETMKGRLEIESGLGNGTMVRVILPRWI
jgi:signal transduction histidine kinase